MKTRWFYGMLLILFAVTGIHYNNSQSPNQQIVLQFETSDDNFENSVRSITKRLQEIGVSQINVIQSEDSKITITYYSDSDVARIENILNSEALITSSSPVSEKQNPNSYSVNVSEIKASQNNTWDFEGTLVVQFKEHLDRPLLTQTGFGFFRNNESVPLAGTLLNKNTFHLNDDSILISSYQIPEVRAGPSC